MDQPTRPCPLCGEDILIAARKCRHCGEYLDPALRRPKHDAVERMLVPVGRPASAIVAGYLGLLSLFPIIGLPAAVAAVVVGLKALRTIRADASLSGNGRAWFGIIAGGLLLLPQLALAVLITIGAIQGWK